MLKMSVLTLKFPQMEVFSAIFFGIFGQKIFEQKKDVSTF